MNNILNVKAFIKFPKYKMCNGIRISFNLDLKSDEDLTQYKLGFATKDFILKSEVKIKSVKSIEGKIRTRVFCEINIDVNDLEFMEAKNPIYFIYQKDNNINYASMKSSALYGKYAGVLTDKIFIFEKRKVSCYLMITAHNLVLTVRDTNVTDRPKEKRKIFLAYILSKLIFWKKIILLYEKNSSRYEESAAVVYEKLIDMGYKNVYFVLDKSYAFKNIIKDKYKANIIDRFTFKHYLYFFIAKTFIGSELVAHAMELRPISKYIRVHLSRGHYNFVFLQHGIMYMISLDAQQRSFFAEKDIKGKSRIVVSSELEMMHFIELGGYKRENLYLTGLPKFDRNYRYDNSNSIVIMITWRPWEERICRKNVKDSTYYRMLEKIVEAVPTELQENIIVLPHPLIQKAISEQNTELNKYIPENIKYDEVLRTADMLITDYSSICYDAFYRGSNVIFYWEEKDDCIKGYGENAKLMLNEKLAFGPICYDKENLTKDISNIYHKNQLEVYKDNYSKLVEFHDGMNTERLIEKLKKEQLI